MRGSGRERRHERGYGLGAQLSFTAGFSFRPQPARSALGAARQLHVFPLVGEGREEGSPEGDLGGSGVNLLFLLTVASSLGLSPA